MKTLRRRSIVAWLVAGLPALVVAQAGGKLPLRNLVIEVRQTRDDSASPSRGAAGGTVVIRSDGTMQGGARADVITRSSGGSSDALQQLTVLNGGRGAIRLSQAVPYQFVQISLTPQGLQALPGTVWQDSGTGFYVQPRWPGGTQPATVELSAEAGATQLLTTVQLPLGEWVTIARAAGASASGGASLALQMRVSAP